MKRFQDCKTYALILMMILGMVWAIPPITIWSQETSSDLPSELFDLLDEESEASDEADEQTEDDIATSEHQPTDYPAELSSGDENDPSNNSEPVPEEWEYEPKIAATFGIHSLSTAMIAKDMEQTTPSSIWSEERDSFISQLIEISNRTKAKPNEYLTIILDSRARWEPTSLGTSTTQILIDQAYAKVNWTPNFLTKLGILRPGWGVGFAFQPTDSFSPPIDPQDPGRYNPGIPTVQFQWIFERLSLAALTSLKYSTSTLQSSSEGILGGFLGSLSQTTWEDLRFGFHFGYTLGKKERADLYLNVAWDKDGPLTLGGSFRFDTGLFVLHTEAAVSYEETSERFYPISTTKINDPAIFNQDFDIFGMEQRTERFVPEILVGINQMFGSYGILVLEYYYNGGGYVASEFRRYLSLYDRLMQNPEYFDAISGELIETDMLTNETTKLASQYQSGSLGKHYGFAQLSFGFFEGDLTLALITLINFSDNSQYLFPAITFSGMQNINFSLEGLFSFDYVDAQTEFGISPYVGGIMIRMQAYF